MFLGTEFEIALSHSQKRCSDREAPRAPPRLGRRRHEDRALDGDGRADVEGDVADAGREIRDEVVELAPVRHGEQLGRDAARLGSTRVSSSHLESPRSISLRWTSHVATQRWFTRVIFSRDSFP